MPRGGGLQTQSGSVADQLICRCHAQVEPLRMWPAELGLCGTGHVSNGLLHTRATSHCTLIILLGVATPANKALQMQSKDKGRCDVPVRREYVPCDQSHLNSWNGLHPEALQHKNMAVPASNQDKVLHARQHQPS